MADRILGEFEQIVLLAVLHLEEGAYGVEIAKAIEHRTGQRISRSSLYITFDRLEAKGYLTSRLGEATGDRGGRPRRYVKVTEPGLQALRRSRDRLVKMWQGLERTLADPS